MLVFPTPAAARAYAASIQWQLNANPAMVLMVNEDAAGSYGTVGLLGSQPAYQAFIDTLTRH